MPLTIALLPAFGARPVHLQAVGAHLEAANFGKAAPIQRASLELRDPPASLANEVVVMVFGQLVARTIPQIQPPHQPQPREKVQRPVYRYHPDLGTSGPYALEILMLLRRNSF